MTGFGRSRSSISVSRLPRYRLVTLRPKMVASFVGWPIVRFASSSRSPSASKRRPPVEDQVVRVLDLREEEPMLTARGPPLRRREERREGPQPLLRTAVDVAGGQAVGEFLQAGGIAAREEGIGLLAKPHPLRAHPAWRANDAG